MEKWVLVAGLSLSGIKSIASRGSFSMLQPNKYNLKYNIFQRLVVTNLS